jgi:hypothetical protein
MGVRTAKLLDELKSWCAIERGRGVEVSAAIGVNAQVVSDFIGGRRQPTGEQALELDRFLHKPSADGLETLHSQLEPGFCVWIRKVGSYDHVIVGGEERESIMAAVEDFLRCDTVWGKSIPVRPNVVADQTSSEPEAIAFAFQECS